MIGFKEDVPKLEGTGSVLDSTNLEVFYHTDVNEIFREVPGVYLRAEEGYGLFPNISLRGVDPLRSAKVTIMEDGIPASPSPFSDPAAYYSPTAGRMSGFEILKGTSQLKYGPNTTGGIINYISTPIPDKQTLHLRTTYGEFNEKVAHAHSGGKTNLGKGTLGYLLEIFDHRSDGFKTINPLGNARGGNAPMAKNDLTLKLGYEFGEGNYLEAKVGRTDLDADVSYIGLSQEDFTSNPYQRYHNTKLDNMDSEQIRYYLRYLKAIDEDTSVKATVFHNQFDRDWYKVDKIRVFNSANNSFEDWVSVGQGAFDNINIINILRGSGDMNETATYDGSGQVRYKHNDRNYKNTGFQVSLQKEWQHHNFELGGRYTKDHYTYKDYTEDIYNVANSGNTNAALSYDSTINGSKGNGKDRISKAWESFLTDTISLGQFSLSPGIRYTRVEYSYNSESRTLSDTLIGLGGSYEFDSHLLFGGVHQGHALPGYNGARGLEEEKSLGLEIGSRGSISEISYEIAYFRTKIKDMIAVPSLASGLGDNATNIGEALIDGVELLLSKDFNDGGSFSLPITIASTFTNAEFETSTGIHAKDRYTGGEPGNKIPYVPEIQYNIRAGVVFEKLATFLNYHWQDDVFVNAVNNTIIDDYGVLDWSASYKLSEGASIFSKITNITDEIYASSDMPEGLRAGAPRIATLGLEFNF